MKRWLISWARRFISPWRVCAFAVLFAAALAPWAAVAAEDTLTLKKTAFVKGPKVYLGDLAVIEGANAPRLASIVVTSAAAPGSSKQINAGLVASRLRSSGAYLDTVEVKGSGNVLTTTLYGEVTRQDIAASLREFLRSEMPWERDAALIDIPLPNKDLMVAQGEAKIKWNANPQYDFLGVGTFRGTVLVDGREERTLYVRASIEAYHNVLMAVRDIPRGRLVSAADVELKKQAVSQASAGALKDINAVAGLVAVKTIFPGQVLTSRHVAPRFVIRRHQYVQVELNAGALLIQTRARAMNDARAGDLVVCANMRTKQEFTGIARADGVVVIE